MCNVVIFAYLAFWLPYVLVRTSFFASEHQLGTEAYRS
jgi:hypothetical protein